MKFFAHLLLQMINGPDWQPQYTESKKYKNWIAELDLKTCLECRRLHGKIFLIDEKSEKEPPLHLNCRCSILIMKSVKAGTATINNIDGADWMLKYQSKLPQYYISGTDAKAKGWSSNSGNLYDKCPDKMIFGGIYKNKNGHLPSAEGRIWYEADINYRMGYRSSQRILFSNDGLIFVTYDHYKTFFEII